MSRTSKVHKEKAVVGMKVPQVVQKRVEVYTEVVEVVGNDICRKCGNCCKGNWGVWMQYFCQEGQGEKFAEKLAAKYPWFKEMWDKPETQVLRDRYTRNPKRLRNTLGSAGYCGMLERKGKRFTCKIHRLIGFDAKPATCKKHSCSKLWDIVDPRLKKRA